MFQERAEWVARVLGVQFAGSAEGAVQPPPDIVGLWWDTKETVDGQLEALRLAFLKTGHPLAQAACEKGLGVFSGGVMARFQAAVIERRNAAPDVVAATTQKLAGLSEQLDGLIAASKMLRILERNPFGVAVTIRSDVPATLARIVKLAGA